LIVPATKTKNMPPPKQRNLPLPPPPEARGPTIGGKIRQMMERRNLKLGEAATMIQMSKQQLFRIINVTEKDGVPNPGILTVQKIVLGLGFKLKDLESDGPLVNARPDED
jgi:hypothetical protein